MPNITNKVARTIEKMTIIHPAIKRNLINYSELARQIKPAIETEMGKKITDDSLIMAVRRYCITKRKEYAETEITKALANSSITVRTGMIMYNTKSSDEIYQRINKEIKVNLQAGERRYIIQRTHQNTLITNSKFEPELKKIFETEPGKVINAQKDLSLITITMQGGAIENPGILAITSSLIYENKINIQSIFSTHTSLSYLIKDNNVGKAYSTLHEIIIQAKIATGQNIDKDYEED